MSAIGRCAGAVCAVLALAPSALGAAETASEFMVAAAHPLATDAGFDVLDRGGTVVDAMVAVQAVLGLVEPQSSGLGGGAFAVYWDAVTETLTTFDGRETAPAAATPDYFLDANGEPLGFWDAVIGGRSVGVPGTVKLLDVMHERFGTQPWAELLAPARDLASDGFAVSPRLHSSIAGARGLDRFPETSAYFLRPDGSPLPAGHLLQNPAYAELLDRLGAERSAAFYEGAVAEAIVEITTSGENPGVMTVADLAGYAVIERPAVCAGYRAFDVCGMGPPSSGGLTVEQILALLDHFDLATLGPDGDTAHLFAEASRLAFMDRALYMADSDFVPVPVAGLLDRAYLTSRAQLIDLDLANPDARAGNPPWGERRLQAPQAQPEIGGTSHFVIRDSYGNALSMTTTIESGFGSRLMTHGMLLNNELTDFSFAPERNGRPVANRVEGNKRPRSSMSPTIVFENGEPFLLIGSPGGSRIIGYTAGKIIDILDHGLSPDAAIARGHVINRGGTTEVEEGTNAEAFAGLLSGRGHEVKIGPTTSGLHVILIGEDGMVGAADPRREGTVRGQ